MADTFLGNWIRSARASKGWTQDQLGDAIGVTKANVSHWETGKHEPSFMQMLKIRDATGYQLEDVQAAADWPLPGIRREEFTSLNEQQLQAVQAGIRGVLFAVQSASQASDSAPLRKRRA